MKVAINIINLNQGSNLHSTSAWSYIILGIIAPELSNDDVKLYVDSLNVKMFLSKVHSDSKIHVGTRGESLIPDCQLQISCF